MKLWAMLCRALQDTWVMVESSDKTWSTGEGHRKPFQYSCLENRINSIKTCRRLKLNISHCWKAALRTLTSLMATPIPSAECAKGSQMQVFRSKIQGSWQRIHKKSKGAPGHLLDHQQYSLFSWAECLFPSFHMLRPHQQCDGIRRWGLWEVTKSWGVSLHEMGLILLWEERCFSPPCKHKMTVYDSGSRLPPDTESIGTLILELTNQLINQFLLVKPPRLQYPLIAFVTD